MRTPSAGAWPGLLAGLLLALPACDPTGGSGPSSPQDWSGGGGKDHPRDDGSGGQDDDPPPPPPPPPPPDPGRFTFAISGSDTDPFLNHGPATAGQYDLHLWLVCSNYGLSLLEIDVEVTGDQLVPDHYFSPAPDVTYITWERYGELNIAPSSCPAYAFRLGTLHLLGDGGGGRVCLVAGSETAGATACVNGQIWPISVLGWASDGSEPCVTDPGNGCIANPSPSHTFAISSSSTTPYAQQGAPQQGPYFLYLWALSGAFNAVQGELHVLGTDTPFDPLFTVQAPFIGLSQQGGPDVLLVSTGCVTGQTLLGSILLDGNGEGVWVTMSEGGVAGGAAGCGGAVGTVYSYKCLPYSSLSGS
jgi:hypothetical protein